MNREDVITIISTWENLNGYMKLISKNPEELEVLADVAFDDSRKEFWRAAYLIDKLADQSPELVQTLVPRFIQELKRTDNQSKLRHYLKLISQYPLPADSIDFLFNFCLDTFTNASFPVAIRVHAMQILFEISEIEPGLKPELIQIIEHEMEIHPTAGIKSRGKRLLGKLYR